jgi:hypothetical protein
VGIVTTALRLLLPRGRPWLLPGDGWKLAEGIGATLQRPRDAARSAIAEARPGTAVLMLPEWCDALGIKYDATLPVADMQARLAAQDTALGDLTLNEINEQIHRELPLISVIEITIPAESSIAGEAECGAEECGSEVTGTEINPYQYMLYGTLKDEAEEARLIAIVQRFLPLHLTPQYTITLLSASGTTEAGLDVCGIAECGNDGT